MKTILKVLKWAGILFVGFTVVVVVAAFAFGKKIEPQTSEKVADASANAIEQAKLVQPFKFLCSKKEGDHTVDYFEVGAVKVGDELKLPRKIDDVTVWISKETSSGSWDTRSLCGGDSLMDLPSSQWELLIPGSDCGAGAAVEACDMRFVSDDAGVSAIIFGPTVSGRRSADINAYFMAGALVKITSR